MSRNYTGTLIKDLLEIVEKTIRACEFDRYPRKARTCVRDPQGAALLDNASSSGSAALIGPATTTVEFDTLVSRTAI